MAIADLPKREGITATLDWQVDPMSYERDIYAFGDIYFAHVHIEPGIRADWEVEVNRKREKGTEVNADRARAAAKKALRHMLKELDTRVPYAIRRGDMVALIFQPALQGMVETIVIDEDNNQWVYLRGKNADGWWLLKDLIIVERSRFHMEPEHESAVLTERI